jgi:hypothetical protein
MFVFNRTKKKFPMISRHLHFQSSAVRVRVTVRGVRDHRLDGAWQGSEEMKNAPSRDAKWASIRDD